MADDRMSDPLVGEPRDTKSWVGTGLRVWNGTIIVLAMIFVVESTIFFWLGVKAPDMESEDLAAMQDSTNSTVHPVSQGKLEVGLGLALAGVATFMVLLAATQFAACCFNNKMMGIFFQVFSSLLVSAELLMIYIIVVIEQWEVFQDDVDGVELESLSKTLKDCMWLLVPELAISVFMQIGAMVFHCSWKEQLRLKAMDDGDFDIAGSNSCCCCAEGPPDPGARYQKLFKTFSGGKSDLRLGPKHVQRLESMRSYYAQLYMENGLDVPTELADDDTKRRRDFRQAQQRKHRRK